MSRRVRLLACGSPDGGDDAAGLAVLALLPASVASAARIEPVGQLSAEQLLDDPPDAVRVVVDCVAGLPAGDLVDIPLAELPELERRMQPGSSHALGIGQAVALAASLGALRPGDRFIGIGGERFGLGTAMSPAVVAGLPRLAERIAELVR